jgi:formylglycine-generating enzyme required for sulfatase activity
LSAELVRFFRIDKLRRTPPADPHAPPTDMVRVAGGRFSYQVAQSQPVWVATYLTPPGDGHYRAAPPSEPHEVEVQSFWMDRYPVTDAQFAEFVRAAGYLSDSYASSVLRQNFLKHFVDGQPPDGMQDHPVVYVSYDDAKAYAEWAGKRLPTEEEWQYAAGSVDGRTYPWGDELRHGCYNSTRTGTTAVDAHPAGASPFGIEDLIGNVWQWTLSLMDDGQHEWVYLRGGCWYDMTAGEWWVRGGPRRIDDHHPVPLCGPGMNRFSTVGFRCVKDE